MKYVVLIGDGMSDYPLKELNNKTPLQVSDIPNIDELTLKGCVGQVQNVPENFEPGSDVANMSIFGYDPKKYYSGRGPIESGSIGIETLPGDIIFRCNLINEVGDVLVDFNGGHITTEEAKVLIDDLNKHFFEEGTFYCGVSYRHLFVINNPELDNLKTMPPHDIVGKKIENYVDWVDDGRVIRNIMLESKEILEDHPINRKRASEGKKIANMVWLWGQGLKPKMPLFKDVYGLKGATITGVDLLKGLGVFTGLTNIDVPGATGYFDTNYSEKGKYGAKALDENDIVFIHVEAPDEAGHEGNIEEKIKAIERIDKYVLGKVLDKIPQYNDYKIAILPDHPTPIDVRTHTRDPVPLAIYSTNGIPDLVKEYNEFTAKNGSLGLDYGYNLINRLLSK
ncbi:cofactor-independent phosphoglycerate mutase [Methanobrevibacter filiformis]|uniref:phosphoglycerate mutase (2,3-diphosphoglycerate-independent) n=1 Tax=Methanobrevibacter filiformis TaxID=55758 RepID=A0A166FDX9_9EURY|nr:cofactor-independent phosphoglycerate mutase [Methanobrevibacter filiformis]KZX17576.1 2,3-bisphosphoglycerate-independent phosphoglycerate mutase [Methanobrevibacter filiformis]